MKTSIRYYVLSDKENSDARRVNFTKQFCREASSDLASISMILKIELVFSLASWKTLSSNFYVVL